MSIANIAKATPPGHARIIQRHDRVERLIAQLDRAQHAYRTIVEATVEDAKAHALIVWRERQIKHAFNEVMSAKDALNHALLEEHSEVRQFILDQDRRGTS